MKENKIVKYLLLLVSLVFAGFITQYFWSVNSLDSIVYLPLDVVILSFGYVLLQILKRSLYKRKNWWDWLYYIGLIAMVTPTFFANEGNIGFFQILTDYGIVFMIIPIILDIIRELKD